MKKYKTTIAICIGIFFILKFLFFIPTMQKRTEWNKISKDYDIIAEVAFDYYNKHINDRDEQGTMFLDISADGNFLTEPPFSHGGENEVYYVSLTDQQKNALRNIKKFYTGSKQESIMIRSAKELEISDNDAVGQFIIIKSNVRPNNLRNHKMYNLGNGWWQLIASSR